MPWAFLLPNPLPRMTTKNLTVYLADDHTLFRKGMLRLLESFACVSRIDEAENGKKLIELVKENQPDVVLLDIRMPVMDGMQTCEYLHKHFPEVKIIMLTIEEGSMMIKSLLQKGANAYLLKSALPEEVEEAIVAVMEKPTYMNEHVTNVLIDRAKLINKKTESSYSTALLTHRELEILSLTCDELSMKEIAARLFISERTVHNHRRNMMQKLGVNNAAGLVRYAINNQIFF